MNNDTSSQIKIFISCHKPTTFINDPIFQPVKVGAIHNKTQIPSATADNTGDNISQLNPKFCELTAQYWAWKNTNANYYGFFHYRRYLSFNTKKLFPTDAWGSVVEPILDDSAMQKYKLEKDAIESLVKKYDIILPQKRKITTMPEHSKNIRDQYLASKYLYEKDFNIMLDVIKDKYPEYLPYANSYVSSNETYLNNMFIMKKEIFEPYCKWLFDILFECERRINYKDYSVEAIRTPGHLAERLLNIYIIKLLNDNPSLKVKELQTVIFLNTDPAPDLKPAFDKNNIPIVLSADNYYLPYIATLINSIKLNSSNNHNYDIIVMHKNISVQGQERVQRSIQDAKNFSLRFVNVAGFNEKFKKLFLRGHFTIETWFRLLMPDLFTNYDKILYLDSDMVAITDVADLFQTNINGYLLAACHDADTAGLYNGYEPKKKNYMDNHLKLSSPYDYFQAGVILFNLKKFRETYTVEEMLKLAASREWQLLDQDVLNILAKDKVKYIDMSWNVMFDWRYIRRQDIISLAPKNLSDEYDQAHARPKIIHYAGPDKPWNDPLADYADYFWKYAKESNFYEEIILRMAKSKQPKSLKHFVRAHIVDKAFPNNTPRRKRAISLYQKIRKS